MDLRLFAHAAKRQNKSGSYQVWTHENHAELAFSDDFISQKVEYIHENPVKAGIVSKGEDYVYSSARNYASMDGVLDVIQVDLKWKTYI